MADYDSVRQRIVASVFSRLNATVHQEDYVAHVKIWEEVSPEEGGRKPRYIIIARMYSLLLYTRSCTDLNAPSHPTQAPATETDSSTSRSSTPTGHSQWARRGDFRTFVEWRSITYVNVPLVDVISLLTVCTGSHYPST